MTAPEHPERRPGQGKDQWRVARDSDAPLPDERLLAFEGLATSSVAPQPVMPQPGPAS
jgi:hypothetical protein